VKASGDDTIALVQGASRGIGLAFVRRLLDDPGIARLYATCRDPDGAAGLQALAAEDERLVPLRLDLLDPDSIRIAADEVRAQSGRLDLLINCAGILHEGGMTPERSLADVDPDNMVRAFRVNALGALLVARAFEPCLRRSRAARFVCLSARVGSIGDNRLGGWYAYRSTKAALNQMIRTLSIQWRRLNRPILCVLLHPGTVATDLSAPFTRNYDPDKVFDPDRAARQLMDVLDGLGLDDSGGFFAWDGSPIPW
jgi:NAD(P)-dependent dehydrogenase (short-subunit alcohol dehydrogenase family)